MIDIPPWVLNFKEKTKIFVGNFNDVMTQSGPVPITDMLNKTGIVTDIISRYDRDPIKGPLETPRTSRHYTAPRGSRENLNSAL